MRCVYFAPEAVYIFSQAHLFGFYSTKIKIVIKHINHKNIDHRIHIEKISENIVRRNF